MVEQSEQEIDLRPYVSAILDRKLWILGFGLLGLILGLAVSSFIAPTYEATALVAVTLPRERLEFDSRIETINDMQPLDAYPELALSDELLVSLLDQLPSSQSMTLTEMRKLLSSEPGSDPSIVKLIVQNTDPALAAELANSWADLFVDRINQIYGYQGNEQLDFFEARLVEATSELEATEQALIEFQATNRSGILSNELVAAQQTQADYLAKQRQTALILQDLESLLVQGNDGDAGTQNGVDQLATILLQVRALGGVPTSDQSSTPWQFQLNLDSQEPFDQEQQRQTIESLRDILVAQNEQIHDRLAAIEPQILSVQQERQQADVMRERLTRDYEVAVETHTTLARTVDEKRITSMDTTSGVKVASRTSVPERPSSPNALLNGIVAGIAGIFIATLGVVLMQWWGANREAPQETIDSGASSQPLLSKGDMETATSK